MEEEVRGTTFPDVMTPRRFSHLLIWMNLVTAKSFFFRGSSKKLVKENEMCAYLAWLLELPLQGVSK